jgi:predicted acylesterase/phospholipase RssA/CRP-like cAMP-binding protein
LIHVFSGTEVIKQGTPGDSLFIIVSGCLRVLISHPTGDSVVVRELGRGEVVGEMSILTNDFRSASLLAIRDTELIKFSKDSFERLLERNPRMMLPLLRVIIDRVRSSEGARFKTGISTIAILPTGMDEAFSEFSRNLISALSQLGSTFYVNSKRLNNVLGTGDARTDYNYCNNSKILGWLSEHESNNEFMIYEADPIETPWSKRCIRQADRILIVCLASSGPALSQIEMQLFKEISVKYSARRELILLYTDKNRRSQDTRKWLENRYVQEHYHIDVNSKADFDYLVRRLTGHAFGLVLGGGGARGFAEIGVIRALKEAKIPIDVTGGTSMGAVISALYAKGLDWKEIVQISKTGWIEMDPLRDYTLPLVSFRSSKRLNKMFSMMFGALNIEDLWIKYFCVSCNLSRARVIVHDKGLLKNAVRASATPPGVGPPLIENGELIVDGGVLNNLPIDVMMNFCKGSIIAVNTSPKIDCTTNITHHDSLSGWWLLWKKMNPFARKIIVPNILEILTRTTMLSSFKSVEDTKKFVDLYLHPPISGIDMFDFKSIDMAVDLGYQYAQNKIEEWQKSPKNL